MLLVYNGSCVPLYNVPCVDNIQVLCSGVFTVQATYDLKNAVSDNRLRGLWRLLTGYRGLYGGAMASLAVATSAKTGTFLLLAYFVDTLLIGNQATLSSLLPVALGFVALAGIEGLFTFHSGKLTARSAESVALRLRNYLYDQIQRLNFTYHDKTQTGELIQRCASDVEAIRRFYAEEVIGASRILTLFVINFTAILILNWQLAVISVVAVPVMMLMSYFFFKRMEKVYEDFQKQDGVLSTRLQENLSGVRVVKAFARQDYEMNKFEQENFKRYTLGRKMLMMMAMYWPSNDTLGFVQLLTGLTIGAVMAINGTISVGVYIAYSGMVTRIIWPMRELGRLIIQMSTALVSYGRVKEILSEERESLDDGQHPAHNTRGEIVFNDVTFAYVADEPVLHNITFHVEPGQSIALLGSTGSGKSTLVSLLPRFYEYTSGSITLDGLELNRYSRRYLRAQIGIVQQEPFLFSRTIRENITYSVGREVSDAEVEAAARAAAAHDFILSFPDGYSTLVGERGVTLSGGQKQRVTLARTFLKNPRILILDDATSSVDTETEGEIRDALNNLMQNRTTFIIAHRIQTLMNADKILVLDKGRIVQSGTHDELMLEHGIYRQVYDVQARIEDEIEKEVAGV
jgi:ATP-binding cassette subfamily B protein